MAQTTQCMKINVLGAHYVCTFTPSKTNPFVLYEMRWDHGWHRKKIVEYCNFEGVLYHLLQLNVREFHKDWFGDVK